MTNARIPLLAGALVLSLASASKSSYTPTSGNTGASPQALYTAAVRVFNDRGYEVAEKDETAGTVATGWVTVDTAMGQHLQHRWRVTIDGSSLTLHIDCRYTDPSLGVTPCNSKPERASEFADAATELHHAIAAAASR